MTDGPLFTALTTSTQQLHTLLRCIVFNKDAIVSIRPEGIKFTVEGSRVIEASTTLESNLFTTYIISNPRVHIPPFQINAAALLQALQIFGSLDTAAHKAQNGGITSSFAAAFNTPALGVSGSCKLTYAQEGAPLSIIIEEGGMKTNCELNTYRLPNFFDHTEETIPFDNENLLLKVVLSSFRLHDALTEIMSTDSPRLVISASNRKQPYFAFIGEGGPFGNSTIEFAPEMQPRGKSLARKTKPAALETFAVAALEGMGGRVRERYRTELFKRMIRAMASAVRLSLRMDHQGALSLQFMVSPNKAVGAEADLYGEHSKITYVEYRLLPIWDHEDAHPGDSGSEDDAEDGADDEAQEYELSEDGDA